MKKNAISVDGMWTIEEVMSYLAVARTTVLGMGDRLHPVKVNGRLYYRPDIVQAECERREASNKILTRPSRDIRVGPKAAAPVPTAPPMKVPTYEGKIGAQAVQLFREGADVRDVVAKLEITFELAQHLWSAYKAAGPELVLDAATLGKLRRNLDFGPKPNAADIVRAVEKLASDVDVKIAESIFIMAARAPQVRFSAEKNRVFVGINRGLELEPGQGPDPDAWQSRSVDVTDVLRMTQDEMDYADWKPGGKVSP